PTSPAIVGDGRQYEYAHKRDLTIGLSGLNSPDTKADDWSDWTVTPLWADGSRTLRTTIGHGSPFVYAEGSGGDARITTAGTPSTTGLGSRSDFAGAVLPSTDALATLKTDAFSFVTGAKAAWTYTGGTVEATYTVTTEAKEGTERGTLQALYRHQWLHTAD